jgi:hypothetical protein
MDRNPDYNGKKSLNFIESKFLYKIKHRFHHRAVAKVSIMKKIIQFSREFIFPLMLILLFPVVTTLILYTTVHFWDNVYYKVFFNIFRIIFSNYMIFLLLRNLMRERHKVLIFVYSVGLFFILGELSLGVFAFLYYLVHTGDYRKQERAQ